VVAVVSGVLLVTLLVAWAAAIGPGDVLTGDGPTPQRVTPTPSPSSTPLQPDARLDDLERTRLREPGDNDLLRAIGLVLELLLAAVVLYAAYKSARWARETWGARRRPDPRPAEVGFEVLGSPSALARELVAGAPARRELLLAGAPRNAIVEAWHSFEAQASAAGATRRPWETSSEFTLRVLEVVDADSSAVARLARLYREARFSDHALTEDDRAAALAALDAIHAGLGLVAGRGDRP
jgi:hypothetical protein